MSEVENETLETLAQTYPWVAIAKAEIGVTEAPGAADNTRVLEYHKQTTMKATADAVPWCAAFMNWVLNECGITGTNSAAARSFLHWGTECEPKQGAIVVLKRGNSNFSGHVGIVVAVRSHVIEVLGGNQGDAVSIRPMLRSNVLSFRWPPA